MKSEMYSRIERCLKKKIKFTYDDITATGKRKKQLDNLEITEKQFRDTDYYSNSTYRIQLNTTINGKNVKDLFGILATTICNLGFLTIGKLLENVKKDNIDSEQVEFVLAEAHRIKKELGPVSNEISYHRRFLIEALKVIFRCTGSVIPDDIILEELAANYNHNGFTNAIFTLLSSNILGSEQLSLFVPTQGHVCDLTCDNPKCVEFNIKRDKYFMYLCTDNTDYGMLVKDRKNGPFIFPSLEFKLTSDNNKLNFKDAQLTYTLFEKSNKGFFARTSEWIAVQLINFFNSVLRILGITPRTKDRLVTADKSFTRVFSFHEGEIGISYEDHSKVHANEKTQSKINNRADSPVQDESIKSTNDQETQLSSVSCVKIEGNTNQQTTSL